jgi:sterol desaturase/sphingolipid hydroxylase (fatty acid hydroxylase superfamily)
MKPHRTIAGYAAIQKGNKVDPADMSASKLAKLPPNAIYNADKDTTSISTIIGFFFVIAITYWIYHVYVSYQGYLAHGTPMAETSIVRAGIPIFLIAIVVEVIASKIMGMDVYRLNDSMRSLGTGLIQQIVEVLTGLISNVIGVTLVTGIPYEWIHANYRITSLNGLTGFIGLFLMRDFGYYWFHRAGHRIAFMWAVHGVHHGPNEFNYSVSLSQGALQRWTEIFFYAPMALFFPVEVYLLMYPIAKIYGFFTHTRLFSGMGPLKYLMITPSLHRIHHASAPSPYIDKNYGEVFSIWDRMFGTYQEEEYPVVYGTVEPIDTWDPFEANLTIWRKIFKKMSSTSSIVDKLKCFVMPPGWDPRSGKEYPLPDTTPWSSEKYDSKLPARLALYVIVHYVIVMAAGIYLLVEYRKMKTYEMLFAVYAALIYSLATLGKLYDHHPKFMYYETVRLVVLATVTWYFFSWVHPQITLIAVIFSVTCWWFVWQNRAVFAPESEAQWRDRVWIRVAGREFTEKLRQEEKNH